MGEMAVLVYIEHNFSLCHTGMNEGRKYMNPIFVLGARKGMRAKVNGGKADRKNDWGVRKCVSMVINAKKEEEELVHWKA